MEILVINAGSKDLERKLEGKRLTRISLENLKKGDPDICLTIFRPLYKDGKYIGWDEARKQFGDTKNIFLDLWQHIKNSPDDPNVGGRWYLEENNAHSKILSRNGCCNYMRSKICSSSLSRF